MSKGSRERRRLKRNRNRYWATLSAFLESPEAYDRFQVEIHKVDVEGLMKAFTEAFVDQSGFSADDRAWLRDMGISPY